MNSGAPAASPSESWSSWQELDVVPSSQPFEDGEEPFHRHGYGLGTMHDRMEFVGTSQLVEDHDDGKDFGVSNELLV